MNTYYELLTEVRDACRGVSHNRGDEALVRMATALEMLIQRELDAKAENDAAAASVDAGDIELDARPELPAPDAQARDTAPATCPTCGQPFPTH